MDRQQRLRGELASLDREIEKLTALVRDDGRQGRRAWAARELGAALVRGYRIRRWLLARRVPLPLNPSTKGRGDTMGSPAYWMRRWLRAHRVPLEPTEPGRR